MTNLSRWEPFNDMLKLSTVMDEVFKTAVVPALGRGSQTLPIDVAESDDAYNVQAIIPGADPNDLDVMVDEQTLTIRGAWKQPQLPPGATVHLQECSTGRFERTIQFPLPLNADAVQAQYVDGILTLSLPKVELGKLRRIPVQSRARQIETPAQTQRITIPRIGQSILTRHARTWIERLRGLLRRSRASGEPGGNIKMA